MAVKLGIVSEEGLFVRIWNWLNKRLYRKADRIIVLGKRMKEKIIEKTDGNVDVTKIEIIHNWEDPEFIKPRAKEENSFAKEHGYDKFLTVLYSGNLGQHHDLETLINAAEKVQNEPIRFVFIGDGAKKGKIKQMVEDKELKNVDFHPYQPLEKLPVTLTYGDISVVTEDKRVKSLCVSSKLYSSLAAGQAILALVGKNSDVAKVIEDSNCGLRADQGDVGQVVEHLNF